LCHISYGVMIHQFEAEKIALKRSSVRTDCLPYNGNQQWLRRGEAQDGRMTLACWSLKAVSSAAIRLSLALSPLPAALLRIAAPLLVVGSAVKYDS
jgi:hypothetical protein